MADEPQNAVPAAPETNGSAADENLLNPDTPAEGAPAGGEGPSGNEAAGSKGGDEPLLAPEPEKEENPDIGAPEAYGEFTVPEGFTLDEEVKEEIGTLFKGLNVSQAGAQKLIDAYTKRVLAQKETELSELNARRKQWRSEVRQQPAYESDKAFAAKGIRAVVNTPEEKALFTDSWLSDHPVMFGMFVKIGRLLGEDTSLPQGGRGNSDERAAETRFPIKM